MGIQERLGVKTWGERLRGQESEDWGIDIGYRKHTRSRIHFEEEEEEGQAEFLDFLRAGCSARSRGVDGWARVHVEL